MTDAIDNATEWVCGISKNKTQQGYLLAAFMVISGLALMFFLDSASEDAALIGMVNIAFGAIVFFLARRSAMNSQRLLVLNADGVWYRDWKGPVIPWNQIANIEVGGSRIKAALRITLRDPEAVITMLDAADRPGFEKNPLNILPVITIPNGSLAVPLDQVAERMKDFARRARAAS